MRELPRSGLAMLGALGILVIGVGAGGHVLIYALVPLLAMVAAKVAAQVVARWTWLLAGITVVDILIPEDGRYTLVGGVGGFQLEPYRIMVVVLLIAWFVALLIDPRVRWRATKFEGPLGLILLAVVGSELLNPGRVSGISTYVLKQLTLLACLVLLLYLIVSLVRTREVVHMLIKVMVVAGCIEAVGAFIQRENHYNIFDHLHRFIPMFTFNGTAELTALMRAGNLRALGSSGHPIELSSLMTMLIPLAVYLAVGHRQKRWWLAVMLLEVGALSSGSRTGFVDLIAVLVIFVWLRPWHVFKCWPALIPIVVVVNIIVPGSLSGIISGLFPAGGLIKAESATYQGRGGQVEASRLSRVGPEIHGTFLKHNVLFGEGFGTRVTGRTSLNGAPAAVPAQNVAQVLDDQWLGTLLEVGILGFAGWIWMFLHVIRKLGKRAKLEKDDPEGWLAVALAASLFAFAIGMETYDALGFIQATVVLYMLFAMSSVVLSLPPVSAGGARLPRRGNTNLTPEVAQENGTSLEPVPA
jgi:hypothetical protein